MYEYFNNKMLIYDNIHGYIKIDPIASKIVDTHVFQRLRNIKQTGALYLVFPTATHSRFEHSIGTYFLATKMINNIAFNQPSLKITEEIIMLVGIAGLCHDLGHLLFSHLFDDMFLPLLDNYKDLEEKTNNIHHENRSINLLSYIIDTYKIDINKEQLKFIGDLINPKNSDYNLWPKKYKVGKWIFQIISNPLNSIDVDKFDYLLRDTQAVGLKLSFNYSRIIGEARVIDKKICYSSQCSEDIYHMFFIRYRLYRQIYNHKAVKAIEILIIKILFELEKEYKISEYILDPEKMLDLVDSYVFNRTTNPIINSLLKQINCRDLPKMVYQNVSINPIDIDDFSQKLKEKFKSNYEIIKFKVGYVGGKSSNPLNHIYFYNLKNNELISENKVKDFSLLINQKFQEYFLRVYCTDTSLINEFTTYFKKSKEKNDSDENLDTFDNINKDLLNLLEVDDE